MDSDKTTRMAHAHLDSWRGSNIMAAFKKIKQQEIPFILDGRTIIKSVTKNTTCSDVINKLPNLQTPLAVFESVAGVEKELTGKTKLLKVWRAYGSTKKVEFVIRKSHMLTKVKKSTRKLSTGGKTCDSQCVKNAQGEKLSKETLKQVSDLAFYVRYQKTKIQALSKKPDSAGTSEQKQLMKRMTSNASVNSMDAFLAKADLNEMARFLSFCGEVTAEKLGRNKPKKDSVESSVETMAYEEQLTSGTTSSGKITKRAIHECLKSMKLELKQKFASKGKVQRTTSTGTISSTDTGYQSIGSDFESEDSADDKYSTKSATSLNVPKRHTFVFSETSAEPRHSTPVFSGRTQKRRTDDFESTFTWDHTLNSNSLGKLDEFQGKKMILQKFMADQTIPISGNDVFDYPDVKKRRLERYSMPAFSSQEDVCRFYWNQSCDSDSDSESECTQTCESLDLAFNSGIADVNQTVKSERKTLRRESAISNLNRFSLLSRDIGLDTFNESSGFDYSFDCTFPRMDESQSSDFSLDFSCDFDESDSEDEGCAGVSEDDSMDSFMNTRSFLDVSRDVTMC